MRSNVETRRCGCGLILGLREGCQRCADAARAKLHAQGVAAHEEMPVLKTGERSTKELLDHWWKAATTWYMATDQAMQAPSGLQHVGYDEAAEFRQDQYEEISSTLDRHDNWEIDQEALRQACERLSKLSEKHEPPPVAAEVSWEVAKRDMMARPEARYDWYAPWAELGSELRWHGVWLQVRPKAGVGDWLDSCFSEADCANPERRWVRLA